MPHDLTMHPAAPNLIRRSVLVVRPEDAGKSVLELLTERFTYLTEDEWKHECDCGNLALNTETTPHHTPLTPGDTLEFFPRNLVEPDVDFSTSVLFAEGDIAVLNKPAGLPCHPAGRFFNHTLWAQLRCGLVPGLPPREGIHFISRLDRETSGVILAAWTRYAARKAARALAAPDSVKEYRVLVEGDFPDTLTATGTLYSRPDSLIRRKRYFTAGNLPETAVNPETALTHFRCVRRRYGLSELSAILETGRMHQIRATLSSLGFPVVGDKVYGVDETAFLRFTENALTPEDIRKLRLPRQALHAYRLTIRLRPDEQPVTFTAPLPPAFLHGGPA